jgi:hypothetical protein
MGPATLTLKMNNDFKAQGCLFFPLDRRQGSNAGSGVKGVITGCTRHSPPGLGHSSDISPETASHVRDRPPRWGCTGVRPKINSPLPPQISHI